MNKKKKIIYICRCFSIPETEINRAMSAGCTTLHQILDFTGAGTGPCGGSCRTKINSLLEKYLENKQKFDITNENISNTNNTTTDRNENKDILEIDFTKQKPSNDIE
jgi:bacterioferritin-associated ferredoxin